METPAVEENEEGSHGWEDMEDEPTPEWLREEEEDEEGGKKSDETQPEDQETIQVLTTIHVVTAAEMLQEGLLSVKYNENMLNRCSNKANNFRFNSTFGVTPETLCEIYRDLQVSDAEDNSNPPKSMRLKGSKSNLRWFLRAIFYLRKYPTEDDIERELEVNKGWARKRIWDIIEKIQFLKFLKIAWPDDFGGNDEWIMTVDGTHVWIAEPGHPVFSQDSDYYSHKFNKAGINYELGISLTSNNLIWMNGPFKAGKNDKIIFTEGGLKERLLHLHKKAIGDGRYAGHHEAVSTPNSHDSRQVKLFKSRALKRHEDFNGMTKNFQILRERFRHSVKKVARAFESVAVICQYKIEREEPLFDILTEDVVYEDFGQGDINDMEDMHSNSDESNNQENYDDDDHDAANEGCEEDNGE